MQNLLGGKSSKLVMIMIAVVLLAGVLLYARLGRTAPTVRIGVLHSLSGTMAVSEAPLVDAMRLAVEEVNRTGGVNSRQIEMLVADCRSEPAYCAQQAEEFISRKGVQALFGCWTSDCRKAVRTVVEKHHHLLFYPLQYEGLEQSPDIIYTGTAPNQQIIPMALWAMQHYGRRFYLVGSDYIFPHAANLMVRDILLAQGGKLLGEQYVRMGTEDLAAVAREIASLRPDFVLNTLNGDSNLHFFRALQAEGVDAEKIPVFSTSAAEAELAAMDPGMMTGHYAAWNYFQSLDSPESRRFITHFRERFGASRVVDAPMESAYIAVKLWAGAVHELDPSDLETVKNVLSQQTLLAPEGIVAVDYDTLHLWRKTYIGRARADGQFDIVWQSPQAVHPAPFPFYRSRVEWLAIQESLPGAEP